MPLTFEISYKQINNNWLMKLNKIKSAVMILLLAFAVGAKAEEVREVSGTVYTSLIPDNVALKLSGDTKLVVNMDRVITRIEGRTPNLLNPKFNLEIEGVDDHQLTVNQQYGATGILVNSLFCSARIIIFSTGRCVYTNEDITFTNELLAKSTNKENLSAITSIHGNIMMSGANFQVNAPGVALHAAKDIKLKGQGNFFSGNKKPAIYSVSGNVTIQSGFFQMDGGIQAFEGVFNMTNGTLITDGGSNNPGIQAKGDITLDGEITATGTYGVLSTEGNITNKGVLCATGKSVSAIRAEKGDITLEGKVQATGKYNCAAAGSNIYVGSNAANKTLTVKGNFIGETTSYDNDDNDTRSCLFGYYVFIEEDAVVELDANHWGIFSQKAVHLNGNVKVYAENKNGKAVFSHGDIYVKGGNILLKARRHGGNNPFDTVSYVGTEEAMTWGGVLDIVSPMAVTYPENWKIWDYDYGGEHTITNMDDRYYYISGARHIEFGAPQLSGTVTIQPTPYIGVTMGCLLDGMVDSLKRAGASLDVQWQCSDNAQTWEDIPSATGFEYVVKADNLGKHIRAMVSSSQYGNKLYSNYRTVAKRACNVTAVAPQLQIEGSQVKVTNAQASQEYIILNYKKDISQLTENDWANSKKPDGDSPTLLLGGTVNSVNYVYTRVAATDIMRAGTTVLREAIYLGQNTSLQSFQMSVVGIQKNPTTGKFVRNPLDTDDYGVYYIKSSSVVRIELKPIPENAVFDGVYGSSWLIEGYSTSDYGKFYSDAECENQIENDQQYKIVYFRPTKNLQMNWLDISASINRGYNDVVRDEKTFHVANGNGYLLEQLTLPNVTIGRGETISDYTYDVYPVKAVPENLTVTLTEGNGTAPVVTFDNNEGKTFTVDATDATTGTFFFNISENGTKVSSLRVTVTSPDIEGIAIMPEEIRGAEGDTLQLAVQFTPANATGDIVWSCTRPDIITIDQDGQLVFTGGNPGEKAMVSAACGEFTATKEVTISGKSYDLWIAGVQVNSENMDDLTEIVAEQSDEMLNYMFENDCKVTFDGFDLTLENMLISPAGDVAGIWSEIDGLTINVVGENTVKSQSYGISLKRNTTISGEGTLNIDSNVYGILCTAADDNINLTIRDASVYSKGYAWGINGDVVSSLTFENANVTAEGSRYGGIGNINNGITFVGCSIVEPANASVEDGFVKSGNEFAKKVVIASESKPWMKGDVNEDGKVDISDVVAVINQMAGTASWPHADVNEDNDVNISDVVAVINIMAGQ